jgi:hypothetical protein
MYFSREALKLKNVAYQPLNIFSTSSPRCCWIGLIDCFVLDDPISELDFLFRVLLKVQKNLEINFQML